MQEKWPVAYKVAKAYQIDTNVLNKMSGEVDLDGKTIEDVAAAWVAANESTWRAWRSDELNCREAVCWLSHRLFSPTLGSRPT